MDGNNINEVSEKVDQAIKCAKKQLTPSSDSLIIQQKRKKDTIFHGDTLRRKYKPLDQRKRKHYSGRVGKKAEMMRQFYKAKIFIEKEADEKMVQEVAPFEPDVDNIANAITIKNEAKEDLNITLVSPMEIERILQHPTEQLDDRIISHAQEFIKGKYKDANGLQDPILQRIGTIDGKFVQVLHVNNNHWIPQQVIKAMMSQSMT